MNLSASTYLDTSFVVSLYSGDVNTTAAIALLQEAQSVRLISSLVELETVNAFELRVFRKEFSRSEADVCLLNFERDVQAGVYLLQTLPEVVFVRAGTLSRRLTGRIGTRSADILHIAAALEYGATNFFSFDLQQRKMAKAVGLKLFPMPKRP